MLRQFGIWLAQVSMRGPTLCSAQSCHCRWVMCQLLCAHREQQKTTNDSSLMDRHLNRFTNTVIVTAISECLTQKQSQQLRTPAGIMMNHWTTSRMTGRWNPEKCRPQCCTPECLIAQHWFFKGQFSQSEFEQSLRWGFCAPRSNSHGMRTGCHKGSSKLVTRVPNSWLSSNTVRQ